MRIFLIMKILFSSILIQTFLRFTVANSFDQRSICLEFDEVEV